MTKDGTWLVIGRRELRLTSPEPNRRDFRIELVLSEFTTEERNLDRDDAPHDDDGEFEYGDGIDGTDVVGDESRDTDDSDRQHLLEEDEASRDEGDDVVWI
jgi:hypothetical protein